MKVTRHELKMLIEKVLFEIEDEDEEGFEFEKGAFDVKDYDPDAELDDDLPDEEIPSKKVKVKKRKTRTDDVADLPDGIKPASGDVYFVQDPLTGERKKIRGLDRAKEYQAKRSMMSDLQKKNKDYYKGMKSDDDQKVDPLRDRTSAYGGLDFDKFFGDILSGEKVISRRTRSKPGSHTRKQIQAIQSLYNDMEFKGGKKSFDKIDVDGKFGRQTKQAIMDLQRFAKTMSGGFKNTKVDGVVGRQTIGLFDPSKSPLPITGADVKTAIKTAQKRN